MQGSVYSTRNTLQFFTIPIGYFAVEYAVNEESYDASKNNDFVSLVVTQSNWTNHLLKDDEVMKYETKLIDKEQIISLKEFKSKAEHEYPYGI